MKITEAHIKPEKIAHSNGAVANEIALGANIMMPNPYRHQGRAKNPGYVAAKMP